MVLSLKRWLCFGIFVFSGFPIIAQDPFDEGRNPSVPKALKVNVLPDRKSVFLVWDPPKEEGEVIIARSTQIIDTPEKLYIADSLGRYKSGGSNSTKTYYDYNLKGGSYYYAVALIADVKKREVKLFPNQNHTVIPVTIEGKDDSSTETGFPAFPDEKHSGASVTDIHIAIEKKNIRIDWHTPKGATAGRTIYTIYRSTSRLTTSPMTQKAVKLAEVIHPTKSYLDQSLEKSQTLYYGVSVKEGDGEETLPLEDKKSTLRIFYVRDNSANTAEVIAFDNSPKENKSKPQVIDPPGTMHTRGVGYERVGKGVVISWLPPEAADDTTVYSVYASTKPLNQGSVSFGGGSVVKVAVINHPKTNFYIKELKEIDELYFGITAKSTNVTEDQNLTENVSYFRFDFKKDLDVPKEPQVTQVTEVPPEAVPTEKNQDDRVVTSDHGVLPFEIRPLGGDDLQSRDSENGEWKETVGYDMPDSELNQIINDTVLKKKYQIATYRLERYLTQEKNTYLLGKVYFYLGVSYLKLGDSRKALKYFMKRETKTFSQYRTEFWTNQTLDKLGRGKS